MKSALVIVALVGYVSAGVLPLGLGTAPLVGGLGVRNIAFPELNPILSHVPEQIYAAPVAHAAPLVHAPAIAPVPALHGNHPFGRSLANEAGGPANQYHQQDELGQFNYGYTNLDSHKSEIRRWDGEVAGQYGWISPEGSRIELSYTAGHNGFVPHGTHLPTQH